MPTEGVGVGLGDGSVPEEAEGRRKKRPKKPKTVEERQALLGMKPTAGSSKIKRGVKTAEMTLPGASRSKTAVTVACQSLRQTQTCFHFCLAFPRIQPE